MDLANSIHNKEENEFVTSMIRDRPVRKRGNKLTWIGEECSVSQNSFIWFDQSNWDLFLSYD